MKLSEFRTKISAWVASKFGGVHSLDPPQVLPASPSNPALPPSPCTYIIYPVADLEIMQRYGSNWFRFSQIITVTYVFSRRLTYSQLPLNSLELLWLDRAVNLINDAGCEFGSAVNMKLYKVDPIDIVPASNNSEWLVTLRIALDVEAPLELESVFNPVTPAFSFTGSTVEMKLFDVTPEPDKLISTMIFEVDNAD